MLLRWLFFILIVFLIEIYAFQAFKTVSRIKWVHWAYILVSLAAFIYILYSFSQFDRSVGQTKQTLFTFGLLLLLYIPKLILSTVMFGEDFFRIISGVITHFLGDHDRGSFLPGRKVLVSQLALGLAAIPFLSLLYGMTVGKYNFKVVPQTLYFDKLPAAFDGFKLIHISDIHSGSLSDPEKVQFAIELINQQEADVILFTGDIVNTHAREMEPWIEAFKGIHPTPYGKFSVLGNHDYGEYIQWPSQKDKNDNFEAIKALHPRMDFRLLMNEHVRLSKQGEELFIVGVENWGHNFKKAGDLNRATDGLANDDFKILLSHDPSHWEYEVKNFKNTVHLTLSGHTHGLQFGIEFPGIFKWSPVQYVYKQWAGLYQKDEKYLYVNRGFGFHAYPGRVGIWPEITVIQLKKHQIAL